MLKLRSRVVYDAGDGRLHSVTLPTFLIGGGEMGELVRAFDWTRTPVGGTEQWSGSLRTTLGILLHSRHPMFLWWGPDLVQFYNDGYRQSLGADRHPAALGARGREFWTEAWPVIGPQIDGVMTRGASTWHEDQLVPIVRNGRLEDVYWTYGYSPVHDDDGSIGGTLVVVQEQTARVIGERRLRMLRDLAALSSSSRTEQDAWSGIAAALTGNPQDLPWTHLYAVTEDGREPRRIDRTTSRDDDTSVASAANGPSVVDGIRHVIATGLPLLVADVDPPSYDRADAPGASPGSRAWLFPIRRMGGSHPRGVLVAGLSSRLAFDDDYRGFLTLVGEQITASVTSACSHEAERQRAESLEQRVAERTAELTERNAQLALALAERTALARTRDLWLGHLIHAQEEERKRVARELHDEMGQHLTGLMLGLHELESASPERAGALIARLKDVVSETNRAAHRLASGLRPAALDDLGLVAALRAYIDDWSHQTGIGADFVSRNCERRLPAPIETTVYRIVQEALTNVARHAEAKNASVAVECRTDRVVTIVEDDGRGFDAAAAPGADHADHFGLVGIRERAALLGGDLRIESVPTGGTSVFVSLPIAPRGGIDA